jgi:hypothetical protein
MARFSPEPCLLRTVRLTRTAYAQLVGQKFYPPRIFGRWQEKERSPQWRWKDLGMKIVNVVFESNLYSTLITTQACGFEMLYQEGRSREEIGFDGSSTAVSILILVQVSHNSQRDFPRPGAKGRFATRSRIYQIRKRYSDSRLFSGRDGRVTTLGRTREQGINRFSSKSTRRVSTFGYSMLLTQYSREVMPPVLRSPLRSTPRLLMQETLLPHKISRIPTTGLLSTQRISTVHCRQA